MNPIMKAFGVIAVMIVGSLAAQHVRLESRADRCMNNVQKLRTSFETSRPKHGASMIQSRIGQAEQFCLDKKVDYANQMLSNTAAACVMQNGCRQYRNKVSSQPVFR
jgi:hypothetical protein